jgi:hypothetical protein
MFAQIFSDGPIVGLQPVASGASRECVKRCAAAAWDQIDQRRYDLVGAFFIRGCQVGYWVWCAP